jgi:hypothetical protein
MGDWKARNDLIFNQNFYPEVVVLHRVLVDIDLWSHRMKDDE